MALQHIFSPIRLGKVTVANRTVLAPMGIGISSLDEPYPLNSIRYFEERAIGEIGMIITPFTPVHNKLSTLPVAGITHDRFIPHHKRFVDCIHQYDTRVFLQIALAGGQLSGEAPSAIYSPIYTEKPRALTTGELDELVEAFVIAAGRAIESGYDGVEVHGAHSYLIGSMMSPALNKRTDKYGGSFEGRMKFPRDIISGIRGKYPDFPVGFKFSAHEHLEGGVDIELGKQIASHIAQLGVAYLHPSTTAVTFEYMDDYSAVPVLYMPRNNLIPLAVETRKAAPGVPIIGAGGITVPEEAEELIASGKCDMVALGRPSLADPHWAKKAKAGKKVVPCIRCNVCYRQLWAGEPLWCSVNPYLGHEAEQYLSTPSKKKKVMIIGAGPAGIRCALTASKRGHDVTLFEKRPYIGGMVYPGSRPDCKKDVARLLDWYNTELGESTVRLRLNTEVTPELVEQEAPDALVIAVGAEPSVPGVPGIDMPHVASAVDVLRDVSRYKGKKAVVVGGGDVGCETACHLADNGWKVTIVEMLPRLMEENVVMDVKFPMLALLEKKHVTVRTGTKLSKVTDEGIEAILPSGKKGGIEADIVVIATGFKKPLTFNPEDVSMHIAPMSGTLGKLAIKAAEFHIIGDCARLGRIREATEAGERIGRWL
ncbi:NAD(P)/FAD-dependent oxidoreductase [bacterium]|nr:NAD(P)/FAD-dependent oxidoreductase [bacterium]